jgi:hypothetical protein
MGRYVPNIKTVVVDDEKAFIPDTHYFTLNHIIDMIEERAMDSDFDRKAVKIKLEQLEDECGNFVAEYTGWEGMIYELPDTAPEKQEEEIAKLAALVGIELETF